MEENERWEKEAQMCRLQEKLGKISWVCFLLFWGTILVVASVRIIAEAYESLMYDPFAFFSQGFMLTLAILWIVLLFLSDGR